MYKKTKLITLSKMQQITSHFPAGDRSDLSFLHLHLHPLLLPEDPPGHEGPCHQERRGPLQTRDHDVATPALLCHKDTAQGT